MERLMFVWDELDDWAGIARHYMTAAVDTLPLHFVGNDGFSVLACLPLLFL